MMKDELKHELEKLKKHKIYESIQTIEDLKLFMSRHVFAVWDFMTLVKRLQSDLTCVSIPWHAPANREAARIINEIVFYEESDVDMNGNPMSHLEMYLQAMDDIGANKNQFIDFQDALKEGATLHEALDLSGVPVYVKEFVVHNIYLAMYGESHEVCANFLYGRENTIPDMFTALLSKWGLDAGKVPNMIYYLERHMQLDGDEHGPAAHKILDFLIDGSSDAQAEAMSAATKAVSVRISLWDGILKDINNKYISN